MNILITNLESIFFIYNFFGHLIIFIINFLFNKEFKKIICKNMKIVNNLSILLFLIGHIFISFIMLFRIGIDKKGHYIVRILGSFAHLNLFFSELVKILQNSLSLNFEKIIFMIGQIGMIYVYNIEYFYTVSGMELYSKLIMLFTFISLLIYYLLSTIYTKSILRYGKFCIIIVYLLLLVLFYVHSKDFDSITIF